MCPMEETTLAVLFKRQQPRDLRLDGFAVNLTATHPMPTTCYLEALRFGSLKPVHILDWLSELVVINCTTLQHLEIGVEDIAGDYRRTDLAHDDKSILKLTKQLRQQFEKFSIEYYESPYPSLSLSSLTLVGIDLLAFENSESRPIIDWTHLRTLGLKSCSQLSETLDFLQSAIVKTDESGKGVNLTALDLRSENISSTRSLYDALKSFLTSFNGLVHLSLLLEDRYISLSTLTAILDYHGPSLRRFIWDIRLQERTSFHKDRSSAQTGNMHICHIIKRCPLLEELGLTFDWSALMDPRSQGNLEKVRWLPSDA